MAMDVLRISCAEYDTCLGGKLDRLDVVPRFVAAIKIYVNRPYVVNRRIVHCEFLPESAFPSDGSFAMVGSSAVPSVRQRRLFPRDSNIPVIVENVIEDLTEKAYVFKPLSRFPSSSELRKWVSPSVAYKFSLNGDGTVLRVDCDSPRNDMERKMVAWIHDVLASKILKWMRAYVPDEGSFATSLKLVDVKLYYEVYDRLKQKYAASLRKLWTGGNADKDIHEEIGIASYLVCFWRKLEPGHRPSFVDLGCGSGVLPYVLYNEGYPGYGVDLRSRPIWEKLENHQNFLKAEEVKPDSVYDTEWLIGNHSDELTPWIPVIAFNSGPRVKFFILPCCPFDFRGKFGRNGSSETIFGAMNTSKQGSTFAEYKDYVSEIGKELGYEMTRDRLRIPSTKRDCLIGKPKDVNQRNVIGKELAMFLRRDVACRTMNFATRDKSEKVRNCTRINRQVVDKVIAQVTSYLLSSSTPPQFSNNSWYVGGSAALSEIVPLLSRGDLLELKEQCGGLKTLLKNNSQLFKVVGDRVEFKTPSARRCGVDVDYGKWKSKPCWFFSNHPNGCPLSAELCSFDHAKPDRGGQNEVKVNV